MATGSLTSSAALAAFIEPFIEGRRVLVFGSALASTPRLLVERGARVVHVCDPAPLRVAEAVERAAAPGLSFSTFSDETLSGREGTFDCVMVENLGAFDARAVVARARRLLSPRGVALFVTPNREAIAPLLPAPEPNAAPIDYYALYDLVAGEFEHVRMLGQAPFVGYTVVDFAPEAASEPLIDSEFIPRGSEEPELFVALASRHKTGLGGYAVVQLPLHRVLSGNAVSARAQLPDPVPSIELARKLKQQDGWIAELEARAETADQRADDAEEELERVRSELAQARQVRPAPAPVPAPVPPPPPAPRVVPPAAPVAPAQPAAWLAEQRALTAELTRARSRVGELEQQLRELESEQRELKTKVLERDAARAVLEATILERDVRIEELTKLAPSDLGDEFAALEEKLVERGHELRRAEQALAESERLGRELIESLTSAREHGDPEVARQLDVLADRLAASEADRLALGWAAAIARTS
jgi:SAM-dependent methyltransferase